LILTKTIGLAIVVLFHHRLFLSVPFDDIEQLVPISKNMFLKKEPTES